MGRTPEDCNLQIGRNIRDRRKELELTQLALAGKMNYSRRKVSDNENGKGITADDISRYAEVLGCTPNDLFGYEGERKDIQTLISKLMEVPEKKRDGLIGCLIHMIEVNQS